MPPSYHHTAKPSFISSYSTGRYFSVFERGHELAFLIFLYCCLMSTYDVRLVFAFKNIKMNK